MLGQLKARIKKNERLFRVLAHLLHRYRWSLSLLRDWRDNVFGERLVEGRTPFGFNMVVRNHPANRQMLTGEFEKEESNIIRQNLDKADVFIDVGANIGFYSCMALQNKKHVIAIEPQPKNLKCLYRTIAINDWADSQLEIYPVGLSDSVGIKTLYGASGPSASFIANWAKYNDKYAQTIPMTMLDILVGERFTDKEVFVKIDVEGFEYSVLCGGKATLSRGSRVRWLVEICLQEFHPSGKNPNYEATFDLFWSYGYQARTADSRELIVQPSDVRAWFTQGRCDSGTFNYIFSNTNVQI